MSAVARIEFLRDNLRAKHGGRPFKYGVGNYPPFATVNGKAEGPLCELIRIVAESFDALPHHVKLTNWETFADSVDHHELETVAAPVFPLHNMPLDIVAFGAIETAAILVRHNKILDPEFEHHLGNLRVYFKQVFHRQFQNKEDERKLWTDIRQTLGSMIRSVKGGQFAVTKDFLEQFLLQFLNAPRPYRIRSGDPGRNALSAANSGCIAVVDMISLTRFRQADPKFGDKYLVDWLLGTPVWAPAGFVFSHQDSDLREYFTLMLRDPSSEARRPLDTIVYKGWLPFPPDRVDVALRSGGAYVFNVTPSSPQLFLEGNESAPRDGGAVLNSFSTYDTSSTQNAFQARQRIGCYICTVTDTDVFGDGKKARLELISEAMPNTRTKRLIAVEQLRELDALFVQAKVRLEVFKTGTSTHSDWSFIGPNEQELRDIVWHDIPDEVLRTLDDEENS